jgi:hypothetical protein
MGGHAGQVPHDARTDPSVIECALRKLPLPYSLALRLRDAGVAPDVVGEYIGVEVDALDGIYRMAEAKLEAAVGPVGTRGEVAAD